MKKQFLRSSLGVATAVSLVAMPGLALATEAEATAPESTVTTPVSDATEKATEEAPAGEKAAEEGSDAGTGGGENASEPKEKEALAPTGGSAPADKQADETVVLDLYNLTDIHGHIEMVEKEDKKKRRRLLLKQVCQLCSVTCRQHTRPTLLLRSLCWAITLEQPHSPQVRC